MGNSATVEATAESSPRFSTSQRIRRIYEVTGRLDVAALRSAWYAVLDRHETPRRALSPNPPFAFVDATHRASSDQDVDRLCLALPGGLSVVRLGAAVHRVVLVLDGSVADGRSPSVLLAELSTVYAGGAPGPEPDRTRARDLVDWWVDALTPLPPRLILPAGAPDASAAVHHFSWDIPSQVDGVPPCAALLAAFQVLLYRYGGEERFAVGVRRFGDLLPLCADLAGAPTFREAAERAARTARAAFERRIVPFNRVLAALGLDEHPDRAPLCDALLVFRDESDGELRLPGAEVRRRDVHREPAAAITLTVDRLAPAVAGTLECRFSPDAATHVLDQLRTLLTAGLAAPDTPFDELPLDPPHRAEAAALVADQIAAGVPVREPVHEIVRSTSRAVPERAAVVWSGGALSYRDLDRAAGRVAAGLRALGTAGSPVAIRMRPGPAQLAASLGVLRTGGHIVWFGTGDAGERGRAVLAELAPACLLRDGEPEFVKDALARWYRDEFGGAVLDLADLPDLTDRPDAETEPGGSVHVPLDALAYVAYTSGSTGKPKGIAQSHAAFGQFVRWMADALGIGPGSRVAQWVAPEHDPSLCEVFATLVGGGTLHAVPDRIRIHPEKLVDWLAAERITFLQTVPSFARELLSAIQATGAADRLAALDRLVLMGEALPGELVNGLRATLPHVRLTNMYGPTETIAATWCDITADVTGTVPIGRPIPGRHVMVLDEADRSCPTGVTGEIVIRSPYVARGYVDDPSGGAAFRPATGAGESTMDGVRWYRTGDLARLRWDGLLEFRGRRDLQVKLLGSRIELAEVESVLAEHDTVDECAVVPSTDQDGLVVHLVAYVVPRPGRSGVPNPTAEWRAHLRRRFGGSMVLVSFQTLDGRLPRNVAGKVDRRRLPAPRAA